MCSSDLILSSRQLAERNDGEYLQVAGMVVCRQKPPTAKGFGFLTIEDESGMINLVIPPDPLKKHAILFRRAGFLIARGKKMSRDGVVNVRVQSLQELELRETAILQKGIETSMKTFA